jgi:predicted MPP superfamily phosphohydrolase
MRSVIEVLVLFACVLRARPASSDNNELRFRGDTFKIVQFTDTHYGERFELDAQSDDASLGPFLLGLVFPRGASNDLTRVLLAPTQVQKRILRDEDPDLVVFSGDMVCHLFLPIPHRSASCKEV